VCNTQWIFKMHSATIKIILYMFRAFPAHHQELATLCAAYGGGMLWLMYHIMVWYKIIGPLNLEYIVQSNTNRKYCGGTRSRSHGTVLYRTGFHWTVVTSSDSSVGVPFWQVVRKCGFLAPCVGVYLLLVRGFQRRWREFLSLCCGIRGISGFVNLLNIQYSE
jgi:hypothetical protein